MSQKSIEADVNRKFDMDLGATLKKGYMPKTFVMFHIFDTFAYFCASVIFIFF